MSAGSLLRVIRLVAYSLTWPAWVNAQEVTLHIAASGPAAATLDSATSTLRFDDVRWTRIGRGVWMKDLGATAGHHVFVGFGAYRVRGRSVRAWQSALWSASLRTLGVRYVFAVQGPNDPGYRNQELATLRFAYRLSRVVAADERTRVLAAAHSSGTYVAHALFRRMLTNGEERFMALRRRILYWNLDGGMSGLDPTIVSRLAHTWFVYAADTRTGTRSANASAMEAGAARYARGAALLALDATHAGCHSNAVWCLHMTPIIAVPHKRNTGSSIEDYSLFDAQHPVESAWVEHARTFLAP